MKQPVRGKLVNHRTTQIAHHKTMSPIPKEECTGDIGLLVYASPRLLSIPSPITSHSQSEQIKRIITPIDRISSHSSIHQILLLSTFHISHNNSRKRNALSFIKSQIRLSLRKSIVDCPSKSTPKHQQIKMWYLVISRARKQKYRREEQIPTHRSNSSLCSFVQKKYVLGKGYKSKENKQE